MKRLPWDDDGDIDEDMKQDNYIAENNYLSLSWIFHLSPQRCHHLSATAQLTIKHSIPSRYNASPATMEVYRKYFYSNWLRRGVENWGKWSMLKCFWWLCHFLCLCMLTCPLALLFCALWFTLHFPLHHRPHEKKNNNKQNFLLFVHLRGFCWI